MSPLSTSALIFCPFPFNPFNPLRPASERVKGQKHPLANEPVPPRHTSPSSSYSNPTSNILSKQVLLQRSRFTSSGPLSGSLVLLITRNPPPPVTVSSQYTKTTYYYPSPPASPPTPIQRSLSEPTIMPSAVRQVGFAPIPATYSRLPRDDELYVMKAFARHCSHCPTCAHPYDVYRKGGTLCSRGLQRAQDVTQYVLNKAGLAHSLVDRQGNKCIQVEIPADCAAVRELLKAVERGLHLRRKTPVVSYDETYYVPPRRVRSDVEDRQPRQQQQPRYIRKPRLETVEPPRSHRSYHSEGRDLERRFSKSSRQPTYYSVGSRGALPVPAKDDWF